MSDSRLSDLALIAVERELSEKLTHERHDPADVIDAFAMSGSGRFGREDIISGTERKGGTHCDWPVDGIGHR